MDEQSRNRHRPTRSEGGGGKECPQCGSRSQRAGPWPWYLGTVGAIVCRAVICNDCGHEFDYNKPQAHLPTRKRNLALAINGVGCLGIVGVIGLMVVYVLWMTGR